MAITFTSIPIGSTGRSLDATLVNTTLYRESVVIGDPETNQLAPVSSTVGVSVNVVSSVARSVFGTFTPAEAAANPTTAIPAESFLMAWNGASWDRVISEGTWQDAEANISTGVLNVESHPMIYNGTTWDRVRGSSSRGMDIALTSTNPIRNVPSASSAGGGMSVSRLDWSRATTNSTVAKAGPGQLYGWNLSNTSTQAYLRFYNASSAVAISSAPVILNIAMQASSVADTIFAVPITFSTGIYYATTIGIGNDANNAVSVSTISLNIYYA